MVYSKKEITFCIEKTCKNKWYRLQTIELKQVRCAKLKFRCTLFVLHQFMCHNSNFHMWQIEEEEEGEEKIKTDSRSCQNVIVFLLIQCVFLTTALFKVLGGSRFILFIDVFPNPYFVGVFWNLCQGSLSIKIMRIANYREHFENLKELLHLYTFI